MTLSPFYLALSAACLPIPTAHDINRSFFARKITSVLGRDSVLVDSASHASAREALPMNLSLRLDTVVVCAVFVFVGAVLLGAF